MKYIKPIIIVFITVVLYSCATTRTSQQTFNVAYPDAIDKIRGIYTHEHLQTLQRKPDVIPPKISESDFGDKFIIEIETYRPKYIIDYKTTIVISKENDSRSKVSILSTESGLVKSHRIISYEQDRLREIVNVLEK